MSHKRTSSPRYSNEEKDEEKNLDQDQEDAYTPSLTPTPPATATATAATNTRTPSVASNHKSRSPSIDKVVKGDDDTGSGGHEKEQEIRPVVERTERSTLWSLVVVTTLTFAMIINVCFLIRFSSSCIN